MTELGVGRAAVVGNSMGGFIAIELARAFPELVERLVLVSAAVFWQEYRRARPLVALASATEGTFGRALVDSGEVLSKRPKLRAAALAFGGFHLPHLLPRELQKELLLTAKRTEGFLPALKALANYPLRDELPDIRQPTLVVWGTHDTLVGVEHATELERLIPDSRKLIMDRTGHVPMLERPRTFNAATEEFLAESGRAADRESVSA
jgi:pimeloyl-ACP methyl ester carboxylesterase